ncbi:MAG TPA: metallopeptidase family protein [Candidatus Polarisedimenticolia bacterium]|nr:metallopeptidase family protein [Candidatus Polarisedimenticolia bacterium]
MDRARFEQLVAEAIDSLPEDFKERLDNVAVVVEDLPEAGQARRFGRRGGLLLGLYQGQPLTRRDSRYGMVFPDKITIFQSNVESICRSDAEVRDQVRRTVLHEIAHHFGIDDSRLHDLGY